MLFYYRIWVVMDSRGFLVGGGVRIWLVKKDLLGILFKS